MIDFYKNIPSVQKILILSFLGIIIKIFSGLSIILVLLFNFLLVILFIEITKIIGSGHIKRQSQPNNLILNLGITGGILIFLGTLSVNLFDSLFSEVIREKVGAASIRLLIISSFYSVIIFIIFAYITSVLNYFFYLKQNKDLKIYHLIMWIFIALYSFVNLLFPEEEFKYLKLTFLTVSIILIFINSLRIQWIAFLRKKQKLILLFYSLLILVLFIYASGLLPDSDNVSNVSRLVSEFSPIINSFGSILNIYLIIYFSIVFIVTLFHLPTAEVYERKTEEVSSLQDLSQFLTKVFNISELSESVVNHVIKVCNSNSAWLRIVDDKSDKIIPYSIKNITHSEQEIISNSIIEQINKNNLKNSGSVKLADYVKDEHSHVAKKHPILLYSQLKIQDKVIGYLFTTRNKENNFDSDDELVINSFAQYSAIAIENNRMYSELIEKERLERELDVAREIQNKIIPKEPPLIPDFEISATFIPAFEVGGDYYNFLKADNEGFSFIIADVSGKGIGAAFYMAEVEGIFKSLSKVLNGPKEIILQANDILTESLGSKNFVTAIYATFNIKENKMKFSRAGHCPPLLIRNNEVNHIKPGGLGLGLDNTELFEKNIEEVEYELKNDDIIVFYTDGITEAKNKNNEDYGIIRLQNLILNYINSTTDFITQKIIEDVTLFSEKGQQFDDITLVVMKCKCKGNMEKNNE